MKVGKRQLPFMESNCHIDNVSGEFYLIINGPTNTSSGNLK